MQNSLSNYTHSRNTSTHTMFSTHTTPFQHERSDVHNLKLNNSSLRASSPHSKTKIKLVSPLKDKVNVRHPQPKENNPPPTVTLPSYYAKPSAGIELGGRSTLKQAPISSVQPLPARQSMHVPLRVAPEQFMKKNENIGQVQSIVRQQSPGRMSSPSKVCINNKCFDIGTIRSQVVYVTPLHHRKTSAEVTSIPVRPECFARSMEAFHHSGWPSELVIQEENAMEELKESYESELKEIKQLHQEIEDNNLQIRELLKSSRVSQHLNSSRASQQHVLNPLEENFAADIIAETSPQPCAKVQTLALAQVDSGVKQHCDEVSVQTDKEQQSMERNESRFSKFSITRNKECEIQVMCCAKEEREERSVELIESVMRPKVSEPDNPVHEVFEELNNSKVESLAGSHKHSQQLIPQQINQKIVTPRLGPEMIKSADDIATIIKAQAVTTPNKKQSDTKTQIDKMGSEEKAEEKVGVGALGDQVLSSSISSGKRRINNSIYL